MLEQNFGGSYWYLCLLIQQDDMFDYIMAGFINGLDQVNLVFWLATPVGKIQRLIFPSLKRSLAFCLCSFNVLCVFICLDFVSVKKERKERRKELGQYPAALTSPLVNNAHYTIISERNKLLKLDFIATHCVQFCWYLFSSSFYTVFFFFFFGIFYSDTALDILKREKEKLIITMKRKYLQAAERNTFTFTRMTVFILFFHV